MGGKCRPAKKKWCRFKDGDGHFYADRWGIYGTVRRNLDLWSVVTSTKFELVKTLAEGKKLVEKWAG